MKESLFEFDIKWALLLSAPEASVISVSAGALGIGFLMEE
jgi:hypothetical protein